MLLFSYFNKVRVLEISKCGRNTHNVWVRGGIMVVVLVSKGGRA